MSALEGRWTAAGLAARGDGWATPVVAGDEVLITESYGPGASLRRVTGSGGGRGTGGSGTAELVGRRRCRSSRRELLTKVAARNQIEA